MNIAGIELTDYLMQVLAERGYSPAEWEIVCAIKEKLCFAALDFEREMSVRVNHFGLENTYKSPNELVITVESK